MPLISALGAAGASDWAREAPPAVPAEFFRKYEEDLAALAAADLTDVRLPFDWSRLEPSEGRLDRDALEWYGLVLDAADAVGLRVWAALWEGPLPVWFADAGGFGDDKAAARAWPRFVERTAEAVGDRLAGWAPFDRPVERAEAAWLLGARPPGRRDPRRQAEVQRTLLVAWRDAFRVLRGGPPVATWLGIDGVPLADDDDRPDAGAEAARREELRFATWGRALRDGVVAVPGLPEREVPDLAGALDVLGAVVAFDASVRVDDPDRAEAEVARWVQRAGERLRRLVDTAPERPLALTLALGRDDADGREAGVAALIRVVREAAADGMDVAAAFVQPAIDGLLTRDREDTGASRALAALAG